MAPETIGKKIDNDKNKDIRLITQFSGIDIKELMFCHALILDYSNKESCLNLLSAIRASSVESLYLMPVFLLSMETVKDEYALQLADGVTSAIQPELIEKAVEILERKKESLSKNQNVEGKKRNLLKLLRFSYTRNLGLAPVIDPHGRFGYQYPLMTVTNVKNNPMEEVELIDTLISEKYYTARFHDRVHLCRTCGSGFHNYRETCPKCSSANLKAENLVHHFVCAYVGPEADFAKPDTDMLTCPKCDRTLRHIGVDYDKPSRVYSCRECKNNFQDSVMKTLCFNCKAEDFVENLKEQDIVYLELTEKGEESARNGFTSESRQEITINGFVSYSTFNIFLKYEIERLKTASLVSSAGSIVLTANNNRIFSLEKTNSNLLSEVGEFIRNNAGGSDILSLGRENSILILCPDQSVEKTDTKLQRIALTIENLLRTNLKDDSIRVNYFVQPLNGTTNKESVLDGLLMQRAAL